MTPKRHNRLAECEGKHPYTVDKAREVASRSQHDLTAYRCRHCRAWHVGGKTSRGEPYRRQKFNWMEMEA